MSTKDIRIQAEDFDPGAETKALTEGRRDVGAVVTFIGIVRGGGELKTMRLEHYPAMTSREIEAHIDEAKRRWPLLGVRVVHRIGELEPGENIVFVGVASVQRRAAFEAADFLMDYLKTNAPFWKFEERGESGNWVESRGEDEEALKRWR
jgi:molybdopterin synthase catalytic subunit